MQAGSAGVCVVLRQKEGSVCVCARLSPAHDAMSQGGVTISKRVTQPHGRLDTHTDKPKRQGFGHIRAKFGGAALYAMSGK